MPVASLSACRAACLQGFCRLSRRKVWRRGALLLFWLAVIYGVSFILALSLITFGVSAVLALTAADGAPAPHYAQLVYYGAIAALVPVATLAVVIGWNSRQ